MVDAYHSLVDASHRSVGILVNGPLAPTLINHGCPLDLSHTAFPVGMCTRTLFEKAEITLWRRELHTYHVEIERSFAQYVWNMLVAAPGEFASALHRRLWRARLRSTSTPTTLQLQSA